jgi:IS66 C-terminal element
VLNRKNALFAGHDQGAENWACIASLIETCKLHGVDPQAYLADVLTKLVNLWPAARRAHALGLGRPALHPQPRGVTHRIAPQPQLKNQAVRSVQSKDRLQTICRSRKRPLMRVGCLEFDLKPVRVRGREEPFGR